MILISKIYHTQSIRKNPVNKLFAHVQILEIQCSNTIIKIKESAVNIIQQ